eukprot:3420769-Pleurochrysis_carterae.AAC.1
MIAAVCFASRSGAESNGGPSFHYQRARANQNANPVYTPADGSMASRFAPGYTSGISCAPLRVSFGSNASQGVSHPGENTFKRMAVAIQARKGKVEKIYSRGRRAIGFTKHLRSCVNQRRSDPDLRNVSAAEVEKRLLLQRLVFLQRTLFLSLFLLASPLVLQPHLHAPPGSGVSFGQLGSLNHAMPDKNTILSQEGSRNHPPIAGAAPAGDNDSGGSSSTPAAAGSSKAVDSVRNAVNKMPTGILRPAAADGEADADADADVEADAVADAPAPAPAAPAPAPAPATPACFPAGRHAATYKLECVHLRQRIDAHRNTMNSLEAETINPDEKIVRVLQERDYVRHEDAAQHEGAASAAEKARVCYKNSIKRA